MIQTKEFDPKCTEFIADGFKFIKRQKLSIERYEQFELLQPQLAFGIDFETLFKLDKKQYELINQMKFADAAVISHNRMTSIRGLLDGKREHPALLMCALIFCFEDEDPGTYDENLQMKKIACWRKEGYAIEGFFYFAASTLKGLPKAYAEYTMEELNESGNLKINRE